VTPDSPGPAVVLVFDGTCGFCTWCARWLRRRAPAGRVLVVAAQAPGVRERYQLSQLDTDGAAWAIDADGRKHRGAAAINRALAELPGGWPRLAGAYRVPPLRLIEDAVYAVVARARPQLSYLTRTPPEID